MPAKKTVTKQKTAKMTARKKKATVKKAAPAAKRAASSAKRKTAAKTASAGRKVAAKKARATAGTGTTAAGKKAARGKMATAKRATSAGKKAAVKRVPKRAAASKTKAKSKATPAGKTAAKRRKAPAAKQRAAGPKRRMAVPQATPQVTVDMKTTAISKKMSKAEVLTELAQATNLRRAQVASVFDGLEQLIERHVKRRGVGEFSISGLVKIRKIRKVATRKRMGRNPKTGEQIEIPAKPAHNRVRVSPLGKLKSMIP